MKVLQQKNVYFVDLNKSVYKGFVETTIQRESDENTAVYRANDLEILKVEILIPDKSIIANYRAKDLMNVINKHEKSFCRDMWKEIGTDNNLEISIPESVKESTFTIRITYGTGENNGAIEFYKPTSEEDRHKEIVASNRVFDSSAIFPALVTPHKNPWELIYIVPNNEETKIISAGIFRSVREEENVTLYSYSVDLAYSGHLNFCVGTFDAYEVTTGDDKRAVYLPKGLDSYKECVKEFCCDIENLIRYSEYFLQREYPFKTLSVAFIFGDANKVYGQNTVFLDLANLTSSSDIEPMFILKRLVADILSSQIFYFYFSVFEMVDFWIFEGMKGYFCDYCVRYLLGNNEFLYNLKKDRDYVLDSDITEYALYDTRRTLLSMTTKFFRIKAKVFFHVLEGRLSKAFMEKISNYALKRREEVGEDYTCEFIRLVKDVTGKDLKPLFETYVFRPGVVKMKLSFTINKKINKVDFTIEQSPTSILSNANRTINGPITVRAHEMEGVFEHILTLDQENSFYYHPRTKKKKKIDEEEEVMPLLWMRVDPKGEHLAKIILEQPDYMFIEQLLDKNVIGQMEALESLSVKPSAQICEIFERILENAHIFYKIRIDVLYILSRTVVGTYYGFQRLIQYFIKKYCVQTSTVVKPNDFLFIPYFLQKHLVKALSLTDPFIFKNYSGREVGSASIVCAFIINILRFNDNSLNSYSDSWYLASVIEDLSFPLSSMNYSKLYLSGDPEESVSNVYGKQSSNREYRMQEKGKDEISELFRSEEAAMSFDEAYEERDKSEDSSSVKMQSYKDVEKDLPEGNRKLEEYKSLEKMDASLFDDSNYKSKKMDKVEASNSTNYAKVSIDEVERFRILDMVFPSHKNLVTKACIYALGRLSLFGKANIRKETLIQLSEYPNYSGVRIAALEVLIVLFYEDDKVLGLAFRRLQTETFTTKYVILSLLVKLSSSSKFSFKGALKKKRAELFELLRINQGNTVIKDIISDLIYLVEDADVSLEEYRKAVVSSYEDTFSANVYKAFNKLDKDIKREVHVTIKLSNMEVLRRKLLHAEYIIRLPALKNIEPPNGETKDVGAEKMDFYVGKDEDISSIPRVKMRKVLNTEPTSKINVTSNPVRQKEKLLGSEMENRAGEMESNLSSSKVSGNGGMESLAGKRKTGSLGPIKNVKASGKFSRMEGGKDTYGNVNSRPVLHGHSSTADEETANMPQKDEKIGGMLKTHENAASFEAKNHNVLYDGKEVSQVGAKVRVPGCFKIRIKAPEIKEKSDLAYATRTGGCTGSGCAFGAETNGGDMTNVDEHKADKSSILAPSSSCVSKASQASFSTSQELNGTKGLQLQINLSPAGFISVSNKSISTSPNFKENAFEYPEVHHNPPIPLKSSPLDDPNAFIYSKTLEGFSTAEIDAFIRENFRNNFFCWEPLTFEKIGNAIKKGTPYQQVMIDMERILVFVLSCASFDSKVQDLAKRIFNSFEKAVFNGMPIPPLVSPMTDKLRNHCSLFLSEVSENEMYFPFVYPVNSEMLANYTEIVRTPVSLKYIKKKMLAYQSFDSFMGDLRQISKNCLYYNHAGSEITDRALHLRKAVEDFYNNTKETLNHKPTYSVIAELLSKYNTNGWLEEVINKVQNKEYRSFGQIETDLEIIHRRYPKYTSNGKISEVDLSEIRRLFFFWFNILEGRILCWSFHGIED